MAWNRCTLPSLLPRNKERERDYSPMHSVLKNVLCFNLLNYVTYCQKPIKLFLFSGYTYKLAFLKTLPTHTTRPDCDVWHYFKKEDRK